MNFINLYHLKQEALSTRYSPNTSIYTHKGIQLLAENELKYIQSTNVSDGIELEDFAVFAVSLCGNKRTDISTNFMIERVYQDNNGIDQIEWSLKDLPDLGYGLVYLEVNQILLGETVYADTWYSNVFMITNYNYEKTTRIDYRDSVLDTMLSTQLKVFFWQSDIEDTLSSYTEIGTGQRRTIEATFSEYETWDMEIMSKELALKLKSLFKNTFVYFDFIRTFPFNSFEIPKLIANENFVRFNFELSFDRSDIYDPNYVAPIPDDSPKIILTEIQYSANNNIIVYYQVYGFEPSILRAETSLDGVNWVLVPPQFAIFDLGGYFYHASQYPYGTNVQIRLIAPVESKISNVLSYIIDPPQTIAEVTADYILALNRWRIKVDYTQSYYNGLNIVMITKKNADNPIETTEPNDGSVARNIIGLPGDLVAVSLRSTDSMMQSETITITLTL